MYSKKRFLNVCCDWRKKECNLFIIIENKLLILRYKKQLKLRITKNHWKYNEMSI